MASQRATDLLFRPPLISIRTFPRWFEPPTRRNMPSVSRSFSASRSRSQPDEPHAAASDKPVQDTTRESKATITQAIDDLFPPSSSSHSRVPPATSADELSRAFSNRHRSSFGAAFSPAPSPTTRRQPFDFSRMDMGSLEQAQGQPPATTTPSFLEASQPQRYPRLNASTGRSVELTVGRDLVKGIAQLNMLLARNKVRADFNKQRFHERAGLKRKRLKSERWRKRFKVGFRDVVSRVGELTGKGW